MSSTITTTARIDRGHPLRLRGAKRITVRCGTLWVTRDGEADDLILEEGMSVALDGRRQALVTALGAAAVACVTPLQAPAPVAPWQRAWRKLFAPAAGLPA